MLTERDITLVEWIGRQGAARAQHVMTRFSMGRTATYRRLHELVEFGLIRRHRLLYNDGGLLTATAEGLRCAGLDRLTPARVSLALVPHMIASAALAAEIEPELHDWTLLSDREHRAAESAACRPIASAIIGGQQNGHQGLHRPDFALVRRDGDDIVAIEVELTLKNRKRLERILRGYLRNQNVTVVRYHAAAAIADGVRRAASAVGADSIVELAPLPSTGLTVNRSRCERHKRPARSAAADSRGSRSAAAPAGIHDLRPCPDRAASPSQDRAGPPIQPERPRNAPCRVLPRSHRDSSLRAG